MEVSELNLLGVFPRKALGAALAALVLFAPGDLRAIDLTKLLTYSAAELAMLPPYCPYTPGYTPKIPEAYANKAEIARWYRVFGPEFQHFHHHCWALAMLNYATYGNFSAKDRIQLLKGAVYDFDYVLRNVSPNYKMVPEVLTKRAEANIRADNPGPAIKDLGRALELKPDYWPAHVLLSDHYKASGDTKKAREVLERGAAAAPESKTIRQRLADLDSTQGSGKAPAQPPRKPSATQLPSATTPSEPAAPPGSPSEQASESAR